jgi:tRNA (guanine-N7-)-methyltransferase
MPLVRVREHVNPLGRKYQAPITPPVWDQIFAQVDQPLHLDIGCARGKFVMQMAELEPSCNFLGLEIREPLVEQALLERDELGLKNLHYLFCNVNTSARSLFASFPVGKLQCVTIQFPDPWFKRKHQKRRVVQPEMIEELAQHLIPGGMLFVQSDVLPVAQEMVLRFAAHPAFQRHSSEWLAENPMPVPTERELMVQSFGDPVYRAVFLRRDD